MMLWLIAFICVYGVRMTLNKLLCFLAMSEETNNSDLWTYLMIHLVFSSYVFNWWMLQTFNFRPLVFTFLCKLSEMVNKWCLCSQPDIVHYWCSPLLPWWGPFRGPGGVESIRYCTSDSGGAVSFFFFRPGCGRVEQHHTLSRVLEKAYKQPAYAWWTWRPLWSPWWLLLLGTELPYAGCLVPVQLVSEFSLDCRQKVRFAYGDDSRQIFQMQPGCGGDPLWGPQDWASAISRWSGSFGFIRPQSPLSKSRTMVLSWKKGEFFFLI